MQDDEITLCNSCTDLVTSRKSEAFPLRLLKDRRPGEWVRVRDFCQEISVPSNDLRPEVFATWLNDPMAHPAYVIIMFYDDDSKWSMAAHFNCARLQNTTAVSHALQQSGAPIPDATPPQHVASSPEH